MSCCSCRRPGFNTHHSHDHSHPFLTPVPGDVLFQPPWAPGTHIWQAKHPHTYNEVNIKEKQQTKWKPLVGYWLCHQSHPRISLAWGNVSNPEGSNATSMGGGWKLHSKDARHKVSLPPVHHYPPCAPSRAWVTFPLTTMLASTRSVLLEHLVHRNISFQSDPQKGLFNTITFQGPRSHFPFSLLERKGCQFAWWMGFKIFGEEYHVSLSMRWYLVLTYIDRQLVFSSWVTSKGFWLLLLLLLFCFIFNHCLAILFFICLLGVWNCTFDFIYLSKLPYHLAAEAMKRKGQRWRWTCL